MKKLLKWASIGLGGLFGIVAVIAIVLYFVGGSRLSKKYDIEISPITFSADEEAITRGRHLSEAIALCQACHGENLEGKAIFEEPAIGAAYASNLTSGKGGIGTVYSDADYVRAIRHGVNSEGRGLMIMHSDAYNNLSEEDLGAIIRYIKSVPQVDNEIPKTKIAPLGKIFVALGMFDTDAMPLIPAELINHSAPFEKALPQEVTAEYGKYLVSIALCTMCHGTDLSGGLPIEEGAPPGPNIVIYGTQESWSGDQFISTIRKGVTPYGKTISPKDMPLDVYAKMTDEELLAIRQYLTSLSSN